MRTKWQHVGRREITMASDSKLEKSVKRYSDIFGTVLLGMHQDLKAQQQTVDRKLADWEQLARKRSEKIVAAKAAVTSIGDEVKSRATAKVEEIARLFHKKLVCFRRTGKHANRCS